MRLKVRILFSVFLVTLLTFSCSKESLGGPEMEEEENQDRMPVDGEIWTGSKITFSKANGADPATPENQDRITDKVWLTRGNNGGQIYNAKSENNSSKSSSPTGTEWALGTIDKVDELTFSSFRSAVGKPQNVVGKNLVLHLVDDNIYLAVKFTSWAENKGGGFSYERATK